MNKSIKGIVFLAMMATAGCSSQTAVTSPEKQESNVTPPATNVPAASASPVTSAPSPSGYGFDRWQTGPLGDAFFDFDSSALGADAQAQLKQNAGWLDNNSLTKVLIEGHCDSRGTAEYNLALGERRATTAKEYLKKLGVAPSRLEAVSFGEEKPFDTNTGEDAWAKNRRAHFVIKK